MAAREQTCNGELDRVVLSHNHLANLLYEGVNMVWGHGAIIRRNHALRKHRFALTPWIHWPSGVVTSVPAGGLNSNVDPGIGARVWFE